MVGLENPPVLATRLDKPLISAPGSKGRRGVVMALPTLRVSEVPETGLHVACGLQATEMGLKPTDVQALGEFSLEAEIVPGQDQLAIRGVLSGKMLQQCVRCLTEFEVPCSFPFSVEFRRCQESSFHGGKGSKGRGREVVKDQAVLGDEELYSYSEDRLELGSMLREQVLLGIPMHPLCQEWCRGLCHSCGYNRNLGPCSCSDESPSHPFRIIRKTEKNHGRSSGRP